MRVQALTRGYYNDRIVEDGSRFDLKDPKHFSPSWMRALDVAGASTVEKVGKKPVKKVSQKGGKTDFA